MAAPHKVTPGHHADRENIREAQTRIEVICTLTFLLLLLLLLLLSCFCCCCCCCCCCPVVAVVIVVVVLLQLLLICCCCFFFAVVVVRTRIQVIQPCQIEPWKSNKPAKNKFTYVIVRFQGCPGANQQGCQRTNRNEGTPETMMIIDWLNKKLEMALMTTTRQIR